MKALLTIILCGLILISSAQEQKKTGYLVCTTGALKTKCKVVENTCVIDSIVGMYFPAIQINSAKHFKTDHVLEISDYTVIFYAEKKEIIKRKNGKLRLKKIKR